MFTVKIWQYENGEHFTVMNNIQYTVYVNEWLSYKMIIDVTHPPPQKKIVCLLIMFIIYILAEWQVNVYFYIYFENWDSNSIQ